MDKELEQKIFYYITTLEDTNEGLLKSLKYSVAVLKEIKPSAPNTQKWQEMLNTFKETIKVGERIIGEKTPGWLEYPMAEKLNDKEIVSLEELLMANVIQTDAVTQLLIEKGIISEQEFFTKLKQVQAEWESKKGTKVQWETIMGLWLNLAK